MHTALIRARLLILAMVGAALLAACSEPAQDRARDEAREAAATAGQAAREAAADAGEAINEGTITGKIKAKMALDESVKALDISVETEAGIVTLTGHVDNAAQRDRAVRLARETAGVTRVVDKLQVGR